MDGWAVLMGSAWPTNDRDSTLLVLVLVLVLNP
jgi:hypothetical protein